MSKEAARGLNGIAIVISMAPDVCKTPVGPSLVPIPYPIVAIFSLATNTKPKVLFAGEPAFTLDSFIQQVIGDEPGVGGGIKSGTFKMIAKPIEFSPTVKSQTQNVIRNNDKFEMNNGNTIGILIFILLGPGPVSPSGSIDIENDPPVVAETPQEAGFLKGLTDRGGEMWKDIKGMGGTLRDAAGFGENAGDFQKAWSGIWDSAKAVGKLGASAAIAMKGNQLGLGDLPIVNEAENHLKSVGSAAWDSVSAGYEAAYAEGGLPQALGRGTADVGAVALEALAGKGMGALAKGAKGAGAAAEVADALGDTAKVTAKIEDGADAAQGLSKIDNATDNVALSNKAASGKPSEKVLVSKAGVAASRAEFDRRFAGKFKTQKEADAAWKSYQQSSQGSGELVIGRLPDTKAGGQLGMNYLDNPDWTPNVNDSFIQGGIDAKKPFYLGSNTTPDNLFNPPGDPFPETIFKRELDQLNAAGYRQVGNYMIPP